MLLRFSAAEAVDGGVAEEEDGCACEQPQRDRGA